MLPGIPLTQDAADFEFPDLTTTRPPGVLSRLTLTDKLVAALAVIALASPFVMRGIANAGSSSQIARLGDISEIRPIDIALGHEEARAEAAFFEGLGETESIIAGSAEAALDMALENAAWQDADPVRARIDPIVSGIAPEQEAEAIFIDDFDAVDAASIAEDEDTGRGEALRNAADTAKSVAGIVDYASVPENIPPIQDIGEPAGVRDEPEAELADDAKTESEVSVAEAVSSDPDSPDHATEADTPETEVDVVEIPVQTTPPFGTPLPPTRPSGNPVWLAGSPPPEGFVFKAPELQESFPKPKPSTGAVVVSLKNPDKPVVITESPLGPPDPEVPTRVAMAETPAALTASDAVDEPVIEAPAVRPQVGNKPRIALVISAAGLNSEITEFAIKSLPAGITLAFAPVRKEAGPLAAKAKQDGHTVLVEIPMEPVNKTRDPGPMTLRVADPVSENLERLEQAIARIPAASGASSYLGARFNAEEGAAAPIVQALARRGLFFFENQPTERSVLQRLSARSNLPYARGVTVIDRSRSATAIRASLDALERRARQQGVAVGVGSTIRATVSTVALWAKEAQKRGVEFVPITEVKR